MAPNKSLKFSLLALIFNGTLNSKKILYHLAFWLLAYFFWIYIFRNSTLVLTRAITIQFCYLVFIAANYYYNTLYTIPALLNKKRYAYFVGCFFAGILLGALIRVPVSWLVSKYIFKVSVVSFNAPRVFFDSLINILFWVALFLAAKMIAERITSQRYIEQVERERAANELNFLRAQFNPHFLFNSINSIYASIDKTNKGARNMLLIFSEMLRYQLYECNVELIDLDREVNYIKNYISLQKSRIDERITVSFFAGEINAGIQIAPLILITFIENAFKYVGYNEGKENIIEIRLDYAGGDLTFTVFNTKDAFFAGHAEKSSGLGIANTKRRLELLYPGRHLLQMDEHDTHYAVTLTLMNL